MNDEQLKALLQHSQEKPSEEAKQRAISLAVAEFEASHARSQKNIFTFFQGIFAWLRPMGNVNKQPEEKPMRKVNSPWMLGSAATAVVGMFAVLLVNFEPRPPIDAVAPLPLVLHEPQVSKPASPIDANTDNEIAVAEQEHREESEKKEVVTGFRQSLQDALKAKRNTSHITDGISAEDIGRSSDQNIAEALQQVAGVSVTASSAELGGRTVILKGTSAKLRSANNADYEGSLPVPAKEYRDDFESVKLNPIKRVAEEPVSTFSIDVDTASYSFVRRELNAGRLPNKDAVRIEEMLNYFDYNYPVPKDKSVPFSSTVTVSDSPWSKGKKLLHVGIKGYDIQSTEQPRSNLVFLLDVSGSMGSPDKLPLVKQSMHLLLSQLHPEDTVGIVVYAGAAGTVLEPTAVKDKAKIFAALDRLNAGGSTAGAQGIELAYQLAEANFDKNAVNRIMLATDGDFNVGITDREALKGYIERKRDKGIYLSVLGFGQGNYHDHLMQTLAQNGNGVAAYIDTLSEAQKVLVDEATSTLFPIAKDVKIQVEFNPATVSEYRLVGYETRALKREDFNNDKVDAGDIGAGHTVTAIYEFTPANTGADSVDALRYSANKEKPVREASDAEYAFLKMRYKLPSENVSKLLQTKVAAKNTDFSDRPSGLKSDIDFGIAVAGFAQLLKDEKYLNDWSYDDALNLAQKNRGEDLYGYRTEFVQLIRKAKVANEL